MITDDKIISLIREHLDWAEFEVLYAVLRANSADRVIVTPPRKDGGIDVISWVFHSGNFSEVRLTQVKHYGENNLVEDSEIKTWWNQKEVQAAIQAAHKAANDVTIEWVTSSRFRNPVKGYAWEQNISQFDEEKICTWVRQLLDTNEYTFDELLEVDTFLDQGTIERITSIREVLPVTSGVQSKVDRRGYARLGFGEAERTVDVWAPGMYRIKEEVAVDEEGKVDIGSAYHGTRVWLKHVDQPDDWWS